MPWNTGSTILAKSNGAELDADVIFTAALLGLVIDYDERGKQFRVTMEPEIEEAVWEKRTKKDLDSMNAHNAACGLLNQVVDTFRKRSVDEPPAFVWGWCPTFTPGGMIAGGPEAQKLYDEINADQAKPFLEVARQYLTKGSKPTGRTQEGDTYIGPGAYCGLVLDKDGAVAAMDTLRTTIKPQGNPDGWFTEQIGDRWCPSESVEQHRRDQQWSWGMIGEVEDQEKVRQQGMKFYPKQDPLDAAIVGYTHGLPRAVCECLRRQDKKLSPYEMSVGTKTFKLASCMGCTFFMIANNYEPSACHLGSASSWMPLYHTEGAVYDLTDPSLTRDAISAEYVQVRLGDSIKFANERFADYVTKWMKTGAKALSEAVQQDKPKPDKQKWVEPNHARSVDILNNLATTPANKYTCCNLLLDAFTVHKKDVDRVRATLQWATAAPDTKSEGFKWLVAPPKWKEIVTYQNPYTDQDVKEMTNLAALDIKAKAKAV